MDPFGELKLGVTWPFCPHKKVASVELQPVVS